VYCQKRQYTQKDNTQIALCIVYCEPRRKKTIHKSPIVSLDVWPIHKSKTIPKSRCLFWQYTQKDNTRKGKLGEHSTLSIVRLTIHNTQRDLGIVFLCVLSFLTIHTKRQYTNRVVYCVLWASTFGQYTNRFVYLCIVLTCALSVLSLDVWPLILLGSIHACVMTHSYERRDASTAHTKTWRMDIDTTYLCRHTHDASVATTQTWRTYSGIYMTHLLRILRHYASNTKT